MDRDTESVPDYLARLQRLRDRFAECGGVVNEEMYKGKMFENLPDDYKGLETSVNFSAGVSSEEVKDHILEHYRLVQQRTNAAATGVNFKAFNTQFNPLHRFRSLNGGNGGNGSNDSSGSSGGDRGKKGKSTGRIFKRGKGKGNRDNDICEFCKEKGH
jgi:hypothetical protein